MNSSKTPALSKMVALMCVFSPFWMKAQKSETTQKEPYQVGKASFYGRYFHGRLTANGERFNQNALTAAHRTLPFGTVVRVTRTDNNKSVVVTINDRGPYVKNRVIDLSKGAASSLGMVDKGVAEVVIETLSWGDNKYQHKYPLPLPKQDDFDQPVLASKSKSSKSSAKKSKQDVLIPEEYANAETSWEMSETSFSQAAESSETVAYSPAPVPSPTEKTVRYGVSEETFIDLPGSDYLDAAYAAENNQTFVAPENSSQYETAKQAWSASTQYSGEAETDLPIQTAKEIVEQQSIKYVSPISYTSGSLQQGKAIPYYKEHEGQMTSSGEVYYGWDFTAAHESYPFGTMLKVQRRDNQHFVIVKVNDRLSMSNQPMVLLSASASESLGLEGSTADVVMEPVSLEYIANLGTQNSTVLPKTEALAQTPINPTTTLTPETATQSQSGAAGPQWNDNEEVAVRIGNYGNVKEAISLVEQLYGFGYNNLVVHSDMTDDGLSFSVVAGPFSSPKEAKEYQNLLAQAKIEGEIIPLDKSR